MEQEIYQELVQRFGSNQVSKRLVAQVDLAASFYGKGGYASFHIENVELIPVALKAGLRLLGLYRRGLWNSLDYEVREVRVPLRNLPPQFEGFRILQLSDIHADGIPDEGQKLISMVKGIETDLHVFTGDYRFLSQDTYEPCLAVTERIVRSIDAEHGHWGVLGNHDFLEFVPALEASGTGMLVNEAVPIRKDGAEIWLAGVDDAHLYNCHDIPKALSKVPEGAVVVLLSHTPEVYAEAESMAVDYLVCGHTHGGQLCLPGGIPLMTNAKCPRRFCQGAWEYKGMRGYTSRGAGASGISVRFSCRPEITVHQLTAQE